MLPTILSRLDISDAKFEDGRLNISFARREPPGAMGAGTAKGRG
jgi:hypothetical protein